MNTKKIVKGLGVITLLVFTASCGSDDRRLKDRAVIESQAAAEKAVQEENKNKEHWAAGMEADLERRYAF